MFNVWLRVLEFEGALATATKNEYVYTVISKQGSTDCVVATVPASSTRA